MQPLRSVRLPPPTAEAFAACVVTLKASSPVHVPSVLHRTQVHQPGAPLLMVYQSSLRSVSGLNR